MAAQVHNRLLYTVVLLVMLANSSCRQQQKEVVAQSLPAKTSPFLVWIQSDGVKVRPTDAPVAGNTFVDVSGGRGETVSFQVIMTATTVSLHSVTITLSDLKHAPSQVISSSTSTELFRETYLKLAHKSDEAGALGEFPDGLVPIGKDPYYHEQRNGAPFPVGAGRNQGVWVDVTIPATAFPGAYKGAIAVTADMFPAVRVPVTLTVLNFTLPATASLSTAFGLDTYQTYLGHYGKQTYDTDKIIALTNLYQAEALKHRITLIDNDVAGPDYTWDARTHTITRIDYSTFDATYAPALDGLLLPDKARATLAQIPNAAPDPPGPTAGPADEEYVAFWKAVRNHFRQRGWLGRNFLYTIDEPGSNNDYLTAAHRADLLHQADPTLRAMVTSKLDARLIGHITIWCPIVNELDDGSSPPPSAYTERQRLHEQVWFYHSNSSVSHGEWPDFFVDRPSTNTRIFTWLAWRYHLDGFLYYATTDTYTRVPDPWVNLYNFGDNGDGTLFYPGRVAIIGGRHDIPCPSLRLKMIRAAMQDYEYMVLLHKAHQDNRLNELVQRLATKTDDWNHNPGALAGAHVQMARWLITL